MVNQVCDHQNVAAIPGSGASALRTSRSQKRTRFAVVIVNYNTREQLRACLATIQPEAVNEVVVVDNASSDGSVEMIEVNYPWVTLLVNATNPGYGTAANQGIARCTSPYVLLLNSDTRLQPGAFQALSAYLDEHPSVAIVGPRLVNPDGTLQVSCFPFPSPLYTLVRGTSLESLIRCAPILQARYLPGWSHSHARSVPWVLGAVLVIRCEAFAAVGGFDKSFFMYFEEVDLCYRLRAAGWHIHFAPVTEVMHIGGASTMHQRANMLAQLYASLRQFYKHHYSPHQQRLLSLVMSYILLRNIMRDTAMRYRTHDADEQIRRTEDIAVWKRVLSEQWKETIRG